MTRLAGLVWGHRRATAPMAALSAAFMAQHPDVRIEWEVRSLADFEHQGIAAVADQCDMVLLDHPFAGDIVASGAFLPLSGLIPATGPGDGARWIGPSLHSYRMGGTLWAVPVDGAAQHAVFRPDLMAGAALPRTWADVLRLGQALRQRGLRLGLAARTPHAGLVLAALMANDARPWSTDPDRPFGLDPDAFARAYDLLAALVPFCPSEIFAWNAIDLHEAMTARDDIAYCPCVFGYATYAEPGARALAFAGFPGPRAPHEAGAVLGGAGLALTRRAPAEAVAFARFCATEPAQAMIARHHGQPASAAAWTDPGADRILGGYLSAVRATLEAAWVRPRLAGYAPFQEQAGRLIADGLQARAQAAEVWPAIAALIPSVNP